MSDGLVSEEGAELLGWSPRSSEHRLADGTPATVYVQFTPEGAALSDLGATLRAAGEILPEARAEILRICHGNDVQFDRGALVAHVPPGGDVGAAADRLARACAQISRMASEASSPGR